MSIVEELRQPVKIPEHDHEAFLAELGKGIPAPEVVSEAIVDLTNQTWERLQPQFARYAADPRRTIEKHNGVDLAAGGQSRLWEHGQYGRLLVSICNRPSLQETARAFADTYDIGHAMRDFQTSHFRFIDEATIDYPPQKRYQPLGQVLVMHVLRDRYPRGDTGARTPLMKRDVDWDDHPPEAWGERHKVGVELVAGFKDILAPTRRAVWRFGVSHQTRFDKPEPQTEIKSTFEGLVHTRDMSMRGDFKPKMSKKREARIGEVNQMAEIIGKAKDIRPIVTPIAPLLKQRAGIQAMLDEFFHKDEEPEQTAEADAS